MNKSDFLARVSIFSLMKMEDLQRLAKRAESHWFHQGDVIIREGDSGKQLFIILSGQVEVIKGLGSQKEKNLRTLGPFSYFGEMALIDDQVRSASIIAKKDTRILSLDQWNLHQEIEKYPSLAIELLQMLSKRIRAIEKTMIDSLGTLLPVCSNCKRIREDNNSWIPMDEYIKDHYDSEFSHSICPDCSRRLYPEFHTDH